MTALVWVQWHLGSFLQDYTPVGRGFSSSFGFLGGYETYDTHMLWNGRWNLSREESGFPNGGYVGPWIVSHHTSVSSTVNIAAEDLHAFRLICTRATMLQLKQNTTAPAKLLASALVWTVAHPTLAATRATCTPRRQFL